MTLLAAGSKVVLASSNAGKLRELELLLSPLGLELSLQTELGVTDAEETGLTFVENAILKARHAAVATGLPALADDSGLEVDALNGRPGIYSARFAKLEGAGQGDQDNNKLLLAKLDGLPEAQRSARFRCALVLFRFPEDPAPIIAEGAWPGHILEAPRGDHGFGYDPLFFASKEHQAVAEMPAEEKARASHRGQALEQLHEKLTRIPSR